MPTYDYKCSNCDHTLEAFQSIVEEPLKKCPNCKKRKLVRLIGGGAGLIFKGSGFYITDYKRKEGGNGDAGKRKAPAEAASDKSNGKSTESSSGGNGSSESNKEGSSAKAE